MMRLLFILNIPEDPPPATDPYPADGATGVPVQVTLLWSIAASQQESCGGDGSIAMDVYFGMTPDPPYLATAEAFGSWSLPLLEPETTYSWRIAAGPNTSPVWGFTTGTAIAVETMSWGQVRGLYR